MCCEERWSYINHDGDIRIPFVFESSRAPTQVFRDRVAGVKIDARCGFIDHSGGFVVRPEYEDLKSFSEGYAPVRQTGKWGMINSDGKLVVDCRFDELGELNGGLAFAKADGKAGFISSGGSWVIHPEFDRCYPFLEPWRWRGKLAAFIAIFGATDRLYGHPKRVLSFKCLMSLDRHNGNRGVRPPQTFIETSSGRAATSFSRSFSRSSESFTR